METCARTRTHHQQPAEGPGARSALSATRGCTRPRGRPFGPPAVRRRRHVPRTAWWSSERSSQSWTRAQAAA